MTDLLQPPPIQVKGLVKIYDRPILDGLDLEIPSGSVVGLIGKNGSGKTTALKCFLGLLRPSTGKGFALRRRFLVHERSVQTQTRLRSSNCKVLQLDDRPADP